MFLFFFLLFILSLLRFLPLKQSEEKKCVRSLWAPSHFWEIAVNLNCSWHLIYFIFYFAVALIVQTEPTQWAWIPCARTYFTLWRLHHGDSTLLPWQSSILYISTMIKYTSKKQHEEINKIFGYCCNNRHKACNINIYAVNDVASILLLADCRFDFRIVCATFCRCCFASVVFRHFKIIRNQFGFTCVIYLWQ